MKFATYNFYEGSQPRFGFKKNEYIIDIVRASIWVKKNQEDSSFLEIPSELKLALVNWESNFTKLKKLYKAIPDSELDSLFANGKPIATLEKNLNLLPPVINPQSFRDFYAFEQHVRAARKLRGLEMHPDWFKIPIFYFSNPSALYGHKQEIPYPLNTNELDFELEFAIILANGGSNIKSEHASQYIAGYTICNDWSARDLQREEELEV